MVDEVEEEEYNFVDDLIDVFFFEGVWEGIVDVLGLFTF